MNRNLIAVLIVVLAAVLGAAYYLQRQETQRAPLEPPPLAEAPVAPEVPPGPRYPIPVPPAAETPATSEGPDAGSGDAASEPAPEPLPALNESSTTLAEGFSSLFGAEPLRTLFNLDEIARRFVVTVDNLPNRKLPRQHLLVKRVAGPFLVAGEDAARTISPDNAARYTPYVRLATGVDTPQLVAFYVRFYPLFQEAYAELGNPDAYFNDRLVAVIDHLLETPDVEEPLRLVQPKVFYEYADPQLESLSAGQKILLRMGSANAGQIKMKLRELREALTRPAPAE